MTSGLAHRETRLLRLAAAVLACGAALALAPPLAAQPVAERVLVMPFENVAHDGKIVWLSEAAAVLLADDLNAMGTQAITREERQEAFDRLQVPPAAALTDATVLRLAQLVGATSVVLGTIRMDGDDLVADAREVVIDAARLRKRVGARGPLADLFDTFQRVAGQLAPTSSRTAEEVARQHPPVAVLESYIKGIVAENPAIAISYLRAALDMQPSFDRARLALWEAYTEQGDHQAALTAVAATVPTSPLATRSRFRRGLSLLELQRLDEAFDLFKELSDDQPTAAVFNNLGVIQLRRGGWPPPGPPTFFFDRAAALDATDSDLFFNLGYAYWQVREAGAATYWLREAVRRNPADGEAHYVLAAALAAGGNATESARERELARRLSSTFAEWDKRPAGEAVPNGLERVKADVALPALRRVDDPQGVGRDQRALATFYVQRGQRLYEREMDRDAAAELNRALFLSPYDAEANLLLGRVHQRAGRLSEAIGSYKVAIWSAETAAAHAALAAAYAEAKDDESAKSAAARALELDPASVEARQVLERLTRPDR